MNKYPKLIDILTIHIYNDNQKDKFDNYAEVGVKFKNHFTMEIFDFIKRNM